MYGSNMGKLELKKVAADGSSSQLFFNDASENAWKRFQVTLTSENQNYEVRYSAYLKLKNFPLKQAITRQET